MGKGTGCASSQSAAGEKANSADRKDTPPASDMTSAVPKAAAPSAASIVAASTTDAAAAAGVATAMAADSSSALVDGSARLSPSAVGGGSSRDAATASAALETTTAAEAIPTAAEAAAVPAAAPQSSAKGGGGKKQIWIICYSMYGHVFSMAESVKAGIDAVEGVEASIYQVQETLNAEVLAKMHAPPKPSYPVIDAHMLDQADGFVFGFPTRFGLMASQMKSFMDSTGKHWMGQSLMGKPASIFTSTATQVGGQETTILTALPFLAHHGMLYVPIGYGAGQVMFNLADVRGGGPLGAGTLAGIDGSRSPSEDELSVARYQGTTMANLVLKL